MHCSYIDSYLHYSNLSWRNETEKKYATNKNEQSIIRQNLNIATKELFKSANVLNSYKLNIGNIAVFMLGVHTKRCSPDFPGFFLENSPDFSVFYEIVNFEPFKT